MSIPVLIVPFLNRLDLLIRLIKNIDYPVDKLVVVDNSNTNTNGLNGKYVGGDRFVPDCVKKVIIISHPNAGCAASWNEGIKLFPAPWWLIMANDIQPTPGDLERMATAAWTDDAHLKYAAFFGNWGHGAMITTARGVDKVGLYDENIFPAYLEDCDWMYRRHLLGELYMDVPGVKMIHGDDKFTGSCTIQSDPEVGRKNGVTHRQNFDYYWRKWGGSNGQEKFFHPFNDTSNPVWAWRFETKGRARRVAAWA